MAGNGRVLDAVALLLSQRDWPEISLAEVARAAGVSRQTVYNEYGSRAALADRYGESVVEKLVEDHLPTAAEVEGGSIEDVLTGILQSWFAAVAEDPSLGFGRHGLLRGVVGDESRFVEKMSLALARRYVTLMPGLAEESARALARFVVRLCISYLVLPASGDEDPVADLVAMLVPYTEELLAGGE